MLSGSGADDETSFCVEISLQLNVMLLCPHARMGVPVDKVPTPIKTFNAQKDLRDQSLRY